jgi:hypothetical protein
MILVHIWNPRDCVLQLAWRTVAQARRLRPLRLALVLS